VTNGQTTQTSDARILRERGKRGLTMIELLVVIAIIGILVALLLPAVQAAREAARRSACSHNIVQLIMAIHHYESTHQMYPPGTVNSTGPILNQLKGYHHGWIEQMMPYLEKEAIYHHIDGQVSVYHKNNMPVRAIGLSWLQCPSSSQQVQYYSSYAGLHHNIESPIDVNQNGVFFLNSAVTQEDVSDGLGYTIFLGEKVLEMGDLGWMSGTRAILRNTGEAINGPINPQQTRAWNAVPLLPPGVSQTPGDLGAAGDGDGFGFGEELVGPREVRGERMIIGGAGPRGAPTFVGGFASSHPGGANFAMGDGSIRYMVETLSMSVYGKLGHRADGELVELE
jgi:prepilin-type N-terminal cleavage/methylation domain-containing protein/prepilin-type processing-associated H-X9-DG protein